MQNEPKRTRASTNQPTALLRVLRVNQVFGPTGCTGLSRSEGYRRMAAGDFPLGHMLTPQTRGWFQHEIEQWMRKHAEANACQPPVPRPAAQDSDQAPQPQRRGRGRPRKHATTSVFGSAEDAA